jgi:two-component system sensor histidine kinase/response regulator
MTRILVADADPDYREGYQQLFTRHGYEVQTATDGLECLVRLRQWLPDLLLLDLHMPWGGGDGVLGVMREDPRLVAIPVVLTATVFSPEDLDNVTAAPVVQTLTKSCSLSALLQVVARVTSVTWERVARVEEDIRSRLVGRVRNFQLVVHDQGLVLRGHANTYYAKRLAQQAVMEAIDLPIRANQIEVG